MESASVVGRLFGAQERGIDNAGTLANLQSTPTQFLTVKVAKSRGSFSSFFNSLVTLFIQMATLF